MSRYRSPAQRRKDKLRQRDRACFDKRFVCTLCGKIGKTEIHHWRYSEVYDPRVLIEVCAPCHGKLHGIKRC